MHNDWEAVIGLEIHAELNTKSKLFSVAPNRFGDEPNTNITEVCTGQPGALPVLNKEVVKKAVLFGLAINAQVQKFSKFDRKSYFYPDSPRNFQITQFDQPIIKGGTVIAELEGRELAFAVNRVHIEDDAGMLKHFTNFAGVDYNRAGVPLIEIVSEPCIHSAEEAVAYAMEVKAILEYIDASDCNMEEGSLRFDINVSVRKKGEKDLRSKIEIKNMNSFNNMAIAIKAEIKRQIEEYNAGREIIQATYRFDPERQETILMRRKEQAEDYRYFPEPDLVPIVLTDAYINEVRALLPELPLERERRYVKELGLAPDAAFILVTDKKLSDYFEVALKKSPHAQSLVNWLIVEFAGRFKDSGKNVISAGIPPENIAELVNFIHDKTITGRIAKSIADDMALHPAKSPKQIIDENPDYRPVSDTGELEKIVLEVLAENPQSVVDFKAGRDKAFAHLVGQVMKKTRGKASPEIVNDLLKQKINI
jgi:aspartyl-tRNA(Asn)/glutamyl-tRNA(Gln) amidotransferase subunit B